MRMHAYYVQSGSSGIKQTATPGGELRGVHDALTVEWRAVSPGARVVRVIVEPHERAWVESFFDGPMDRATRAARVCVAFESGDDFEQRLLENVLPVLARSRALGVAPWSPPPRAELLERCALARVLRSYIRHHAGSFMKTFALLLSPSSPMSTAFERSVLELANELCEGMCLVLFDDAHRPQLDGLCAAIGADARTLVPALDIGGRILRTVSASTGPGAEGRLRIAVTRAMILVHEGRIEEASATLRDVEKITRGSTMSATTIPVYFSLASALFGRGDASAALDAYRKAERAAEGAERSGHPEGLRLRVFARFGIGAVLVSSPSERWRAAEHYERTASLCSRLGDASLEWDARRMVSAARALEYRPKQARDRGEEVA